MAGSVGAVRMSFPEVEREFDLVKTQEKLYLRNEDVEVATVVWKVDDLVPAAENLGVTYASAVESESENGNYALEDEHRNVSCDEEGIEGDSSDLRGTGVCHRPDGLAMAAHRRERSDHNRESDQAAAEEDL